MDFGGNAFNLQATSMNEKNPKSSQEIWTHCFRQCFHFVLLHGMKMDEQKASLHFTLAKSEHIAPLHSEVVFLLWPSHFVPTIETSRHDTAQINFYALKYNCLEVFFMELFFFPLSLQNNLRSCFRRFRRLPFSLAEESISSQFSPLFISWLREAFGQINAKIYLQFI